MIKMLSLMVSGSRGREFFKYLKNFGVFFNMVEFKEGVGESRL